MCYYYFGSLGGFGWGWVGLLFNLAILAGIAALGIWAINRFSKNFNQPPGGQGPHEIIQARYARGEITREQYQQMSSDLSK